MEDQSPVTERSEPHQGGQGTFDERWDRYCRLRDTACQLIIYGELESPVSPAIPSPLQAGDADLSRSTPPGPARSDDQGDGSIGPPGTDWWVCCEADMAMEVECVGAAADSACAMPGPGDHAHPAQATSGHEGAQATASGAAAAPAAQPEGGADDVASSGRAAGETAQRETAPPGGSWRLDAGHRATPAPHRPKLAVGAAWQSSGGPAGVDVSYRIDAAAESLSPPHFATADASLRGAPLFPLDDAYRHLRERLFPDLDDRPQVVAWLGTQGVDDGASILTALAKALAERGAPDRVLLVDADFEMFSLSRRFRRPGSAGLGDVVAGKRPWRQTILPTALAQIDILPCGSLCDRPLATLNGAYWSRLFAQWKEAYRYVLIDAGTAEQSGLAPLLQAVDATYMLVEFDRTTRSEAAATVEQLRRWGVANLATVMVGIPANELVA